MSNKGMGDRALEEMGLKEREPGVSWEAKRFRTAGEQGLRREEGRVCGPGGLKAPEALLEEEAEKSLRMLAKIRDEGRIESNRLKAATTIFKKFYPDRVVTDSRSQNFNIEGIEVPDYGIMEAGVEEDE